MTEAQTASAARGGEYMLDIDDKLATWLESSISQIVAHKPRSLALVAIDDSGEVLTGYYNADVQDLAIMAHNIYSDAMLDVIRNNAALIKEMLEDAEDDSRGLDDVAEE